MSIEWLLNSISPQHQYKHDLLSLDHVYIPDDIEYEILIDAGMELTNANIRPELYLGDVEIDLISKRRANGTTYFTSNIKNSFFPNAHFLNYFGESELVLVIHINDDRIEYTKVIDVTLKKTKANMATDMLNYMSENIDDISQICFSKTRSGFKPSGDGYSTMVKFENLSTALDFLESHIEHFNRTKKHRIRSKLDIQSEKPSTYDHNTTLWLLDNLDKLEPSKKQDYDVIINRKHYKIDLPRSNNYLCTNENENHVIHWFLLVGIQYCKEIINKLKSQEKKPISTFENSEYIRFDQVIKNSLNPILKRKIQKANNTRERLIKLKEVFNTIAPVKNLKPKLPIQTSFTLKNKHYLMAFNLFRHFYDSNSIEHSDESSILMGMRNLSQIYEFCCLYKLINGIQENCHNADGLISTRLISHDKTWEGKQTMEINVLANQFIFEFDENRLITLYYEKPFYAIDKYKPQDNTLIRITKSNRPYLPDFTIRVDNKKTGGHHYVILDAKFMTLGNVQKRYKEMQLKYAHELKAIQGRAIDDSAIKYLGLLFGLSTNELFQEDSPISSEHAPNGILPIAPYFSSFYMGAKENGTIKYIIDNYVI
jgi:hypothetical protein